MWSVRPFNPRCGDVCDERAVERFVPRLFGRLSASVARPEVFPVRSPRATFVRPRVGRPPGLCRTIGRDGPNEWTFAARFAMWGTPPEERDMPKLTPPPRLPTPP